MGSLLCKLGFHQWYIDSAMRSSALRCNRCGCWEKEILGARVEEERAAWDNVKPSDFIKDR